MKLTIPKIQKMTFVDLYNSLHNTNNNLVFSVSISGGNSNLDWASDYLWALFIGENIAEFCESIVANEQGHLIEFLFVPKNLTELTTKLLWLATPFEEDSEEDIEFQEIYDDFAESLETRKLYFPEIADGYMANIVAGECDLCLSDEEVKELQSKYPERRHEFWKSFASNNIGYDFYVSGHCWILPLGVNAETLLSKFGGCKSELFPLEEAQYLSVMNLHPIVFNDTSVVRFPQERLYDAQKCAKDIWTEDFLINNSSVVSKKQILDTLKTVIQLGEGIYIEDIQGRINKIFLSREGEVLILCDNVAQYIFFNDTHKKLKHEILAEYLTLLSKTYEYFRIIVGKPTEIACPWNTLDDEKFEELCYDIIYTYYKPGKNIKKMGKSRSRDGGRDITFNTPTRAGKSSVKWIVQCKLIKDGSSLTKKKLTDVSDTVAQYGAGGFCVMTSGVIDSALYDKLEAIADQTSIETDEWSRLEIERFLAKHPEIKYRYFSKY
ncbi:MAG: hypothetical protein RIM23_09050 [Coleofasciculus sp. G3-WIS-01]|uniref:restriction endonuclease n=1 Tax=Coleofasciculus sp. G3-WIS-01 TaxID=3069528 RepID=UPI0032F401CB